jgi:8-oxo-dGTP pyrophosphatase MutT (NUDIX family)
MDYDKNKVHYLVVTGILVDEDGKFLIAKRADWEKAFPGRWTVPGGKLEVLDYILRKKDTKDHWYNIFENLLRREVKEEVGLEVKGIGYITSLVYVRDDGIPTIIVSLYAGVENYSKVNLCKALTDYKWVNLEEAKGYDLIEGIYEEMEILEGILNGERKAWKGVNENSYK